MFGVDCKTVVFLAHMSDGPYSNERSGARVKKARENGESFLTSHACEVRVLHSRGSRLWRLGPKTTVLQSMFREEQKCHKNMVLMLPYNKMHNK